MPITIEGQTYYRTSEACYLAGISRATFFRRIENGTLEDTAHRDQKGWRLFTEHDIDQIRLHVHNLRMSYTPFMKKKER